MKNSIETRQNTINRLQALPDPVQDVISSTLQELVRYSEEHPEEAFDRMYFIDTFVSKLLENAQNAE